MQRNQDALVPVTYQIATTGRIGRHDRPPARGGFDQAARQALAIPGEQHRDVVRVPDFRTVARRTVPADARLLRPLAQLSLAAGPAVRRIRRAVEIELDCAA